MYRTITALLLSTCVLHAVETGPLPVLKVIDGNTIEVAADLGGVQHPVRVRLLYVETPEVLDNNHGEGMDEGKQAAKEVHRIITKDSKAKLYAPGNSFELDQHGRVLAIVQVQFASMTGGTTETYFNLNYHMIVEGWSPYWRKCGDASGEDHRNFLEAQARAERDKLGIWATNPKWMTDKTNERADGAEARRELED
jgi:endonuclease YncB( thermonuclease family)